MLAGVDCERLGFDGCGFSDVSNRLSGFGCVLVGFLPHIILFFVGACSFVAPF